LTTIQPDPDWIHVGHTDCLPTAITRLQHWRADAERLGFYPQACGIIASGDPRGCWAVEVSKRLFEKSFSEVW